MLVNRLIICVLFFTIFTSCKNSYVSEKELSNWIKTNELRNWTYKTDSLEKYALSVLPTLYVYNKIPIKKPIIEQHIIRNDNLVTGIDFYHSNQRVVLNNNKKNTPVIYISKTLNNKGYYAISYEHYYNGKRLETLHSDSKRITYTIYNESTTHYKIYTPNGDFLEMGFMDPSKSDTVYMNKSTIFETMVKDSSNLLFQKK